MNKKRTLKLGDGSGLVSLFLILSLILTSVSISLAAAPPEAHVPETIDFSPATLSPPADPAAIAPRIRLAVGEFDPLAATEPAGLPSALWISDYAGDGSGYYLVQFEGPIATSDVDALTATGAQVFDYIPDFAVIVKMDHVTRATVGEMAQVRWVGLYQPAYRLPADLLVYTADDIPVSDRSWSSGDRQGTDPNLLWDDSPMEVSVNIFHGEALAPIITQIENVGGVVLRQSQTEWKSKLQVSISPSRFTDLAAISGVRWIEEAPEWKLFNNEAADIMGVREVWDTYGLYGAGQTIAVCDTGLDQGATSSGSLHDDFENGSGSSRVLAIHDVAGDGAPNDVNSGHGTHVAGSVLGNGDLSGATPSMHNYPNTAYVGMAPEANLVFQASEDNDSGDLLTPADLNDLFAEAAGSGADLHTNSWGSSVPGIYTSNSEEVDQYVWDHKDFTILFAAGNEGTDNNADGVIDRYSTGSPATAKNCITVGATENDRPSGSTPTPGYDIPWGTGSWAIAFPSPPISTDHVSDDPVGMAAFSSRGPVLDGRHKPDIVAPGTNIASTHSSLISGDGWGPIDANYMFMGGTSMATPLAAGAATIVRQYYTDRESITPSAALIKATLVNGATDIAPGQYGTGATQEIPDARPNHVAGWGRVNLENSIFPASPRTMLYEDETTGLTTGQSDTYNYTVSSSTEPLHVTLAWSDYPGSPAAAGGLVNDLDLMITGPGGPYYPNNASQRGASELLAYDDGVPGGLYTWGPGIRTAVRFTPTSYPATLQTGLFLVGSYSSSYPKTFGWYVYDGNDTTGPGTVLASGATTIRSAGWHPVDFSGAGVTISSGDFFLAIELPDDDLLWFYDESSPVDGRSWDYDSGSWSRWTDNDYMFNAIVTSADASTDQDRVNNLVGIDIESPPTGEYVVTVSGYNVPFGPQPYALVASGAIGGGTGNTAPDISDLPDQNLSINTSRDNAIDLCAYADDAEDACADLTFTIISNCPDPGAGVTIDSNRYVDINPTAGWTGTCDVEIQVQDTGGLSDTDAFRVTVTPSADKTWNGSVSSDWHTADNWTPAGVPASSDDVLIPDVTNDPVISAGDAEADNLTINAGAVVDLTDRALTVEGTLTNNGTLKQTQDVAPGSRTEFLGITNLAGNQTKYYGVDITPSGVSGFTVAPSEAVLTVVNVDGVSPVSTSGNCTEEERGIGTCPSTQLPDNVPSAPADTLPVVDTFSTYDWPRGLAWDGAYLWYAETSTDRVYKLDPVTGDELDSFATPLGNPHGLTWDGTYLWLANGDLFSSDDYIHKLDIDGTVVATYTTPGPYPTGLAWDNDSAGGPFLWVADWSDSMIYKTDPTSDLSILDSFAAPATAPRGLAWDGRYLWVNKGNGANPDYIWKLDPTLGGAVIATYDAPGTASNFPLGLTWDDDSPGGPFLYHSDESTDLIYKLEAPAPGVEPDIAVSPTSFEETVLVDRVVTKTLTISNTGSAPLTFEIREQAGEFTPTMIMLSTRENTGPAMLMDGSSLAPLAWAGAVSMPTARSRLAGVTGQGCLLYAIGGRMIDSSYSDENEVYDPQSDSWATLAPMPTARSNVAAAAINGVIYVPGGYGNTGYLNTHQTYDTVSNSWSTKTSLPEAVAGGVVAAANGKIYHIGGNTSGGYIATTYEYDPTTDSWSTKTSAPGTFAYASGTMLDGYIYIAGGWLSTSSASARFWRYDPFGDSWTVLTSMNQFRQSPGLVAAGGYIYAFGGGVGWTPLNSTEQYNPVTDAWTLRPDIPMGVGRIGMATGWVRGTIWGAGGSSGSDAEDDNEYLDEGYADNCGAGQVPWLSEDPISGTVPVSDSLAVDVAFDATGLALGNYTADLVITSNDLDENPVTVPITIHVIGAGSNTSPTISGLPDQTVPMNGSADNAIDLWIYADDAEDADADLTFTISNSPDSNAGVTIDSNRYIDINPVAGWTGQTDVEVQARDTGGLTDTDTFRVTVSSDPDIDVSPALFDELVLIDEILTQTLTISNTGADDLIFLVDDGGTSWLSENPGSGMVAVGGAQLVDVVFDATGLTVGDYTADLTIVNNDPDENLVTVPITMHVVDNRPPTISGIPDQLVIPGSAYIPLDLWPYASDAESPVDVLTYTIDNTPDPNAGVSIDSNRYVDINPTPGWTGQTTVAIRVTDPGDLFDTDSFSVTVGQFPDIEVAPTIFDETVPPDGTLTRTLTISNTGADDLIFVIGDGGVSWLSQDPVFGIVSAGGALPVDVVFDATGLTPGDYSATLTINSNDPDEDPVTVPVVLHVEVVGDFPDIEVVPTAFDETVPSGGTLARTLTISNTGTDYLMFVINDGGVSWLSEDPASGMVLAGEAEVVDVVFDATGMAAGDYTANLSISSNDPDEDPVIVAVTMHVTVTGDLTSVTVSVSGNQFCSGRTTGVKRCFDIDPAAPMNATVRFYLSEGERNGQTLGDLLVYHYDGDWVEEPGPYIRGGTGDAQFVQAQNVDGFSPFALDRSVPTDVYLPLIMKRWPPIPDSPVLNAISNTDGDGNYTVSWNAAFLADTYTLQEDDNPSFSSPTPAYGPGNATSTSITGRPVGTYYYRVKATNSYGDSGWSNVQSVGVRPPDAPALNTIDNSDGDSSYTVSWNTASGATGYTLEEDDNGAFSSPATAYTGSSTSWYASGKAVGTYYYRVKASNSVGDSGWSNVQSATVLPPPDHFTGSPSVSFDLTHDQRVCNFRIVIPFSSGSCTIQYNECVAVVDERFTITWDPYGFPQRISGRFRSSTRATGDWDVSVCGNTYIYPSSTGTWEATKQ